MTLASPKKRRWSRDDTELSLLAAPTCLWFILFNFLPMFGIIIAFKDVRITSGNFLVSILESPWNGVKNFESLFSFGDIGIIVRNTLLYNSVFIALGIVVPVVMAMIFGQLHNQKIGKVYQSCIFFPYFLSWVVVAALLMGFLSYDKGLFNGMIESMGGDPVNWYQQPQYWPFILTFMNIWKSLGYSMIIYLATITNIDSTYYEAALIDGATKWQQAKYITLPLIKSTIIILFIMNIGRIFASDFGLFYQLPQNSTPLYDVTRTIDVYVFTMMKTGTTGMSSAAAFIQSVVGCSMILITNAIVNKVEPDSALI